MSRPRKHSPEFREQAVELARASDKTLAEVARDLSINDTTLGNWIKADRAERGEPDRTGLLPLTAEERAELTRLRRESIRLKSEREIMKKAAAFFATESTSRRGSPSSTTRRPTTTSQRPAAS